MEAEVVLADGTGGRGTAPAGASRGRHEAVDLRDGGAACGGFDVRRAVANVDGPVAQALLGMDACDQAAVDGVLVRLDGTDDKSRMGGNALVAVSMAVLHAAAAAEGLPLWRHLAGDGRPRLPLPEIQIFGGGAHAGRRVDIQDFLVMPVGAESFADAIEMAADVYHAAGALMAGRGRRAGVADEGGWWPDFTSNEEALATLAESIAKAGYSQDDVAVSLDVAASEFAVDGRYCLGLDNRQLEPEEWVELLLGWVRDYGIASVEDPLAEDDHEGMAAFTAAVGDRVQVVGDDLLVTDADRVRLAVKEKACNAVLLKVNQAGTVTEAREAYEAARPAGWGTIVSARSGETEDVIIVHLAVGWDAGQLKVGSMARSERVAKWNEALRIEEEMGPDATFAGRAALPQRWGST